MKSLRNVIDSLEQDSLLHALTDEEIKRIRVVFLSAFDDIDRVCKKYNITVMLIGGSVIGAVRHKGFIPWDDDLDIAMTRHDYMKFKQIFQNELGDKYILCAPNYNGKAKNRFPQIMIKNTKRINIFDDPKADNNMIRIDLFIIENIPENIIHRCVKGFICSCMMYMAGNASIYQINSSLLKKCMCKTEDGKKSYKRIMRIGKCFSFISEQRWYDIIDDFCQYKGNSRLAGIPTGRKHYFGEIRPKKTFIPVSKGIFEGRNVNLPGNVDDYLSNLYGEYMTIPSKNKREQHYVYKISFDNVKK